MLKKVLLVPIQRRSVHRFHSLAQAFRGDDFHGRSQAQQEVNQFKRDQHMQLQFVDVLVNADQLLGRVHGLSGEVFVLQLVAADPHILWGFGGLGNAKAVFEKVVGIEVAAHGKRFVLFLQGFHAVQSVRPVIAAVVVPGNQVPAIPVFFE